MTHNAQTIIFVLGALRLLYPEVADGAETILTPTQIQSEGAYSVNSYSVWQADSTIALEVTAVSGTVGGTNIWTIQNNTTVKATRA